MKICDGLNSKAVMLVLSTLVLGGCTKKVSAPVAGFDADELRRSLSEAVFSHDLKSAKDIVRRGAVVDARGTYDSTVLHEAASRGDRKAAEMLLALGADKEAQDQFGTPLHSAAVGGHVNVAQVLVANGADVNARSALGDTPLDKAIWKNEGNMAAFLLAHGAHHTLFSAAALGETDKVAELLASGADVNAACIQGVTPLFAAAANGHEGVVRLLLDNGADVNLPLKDTSSTPLHAAAGGGDESVVRLLIGRGAAINAKRFDGETPLDLARNPRVVALLREHGGKLGEHLK